MKNENNPEVVPEVLPRKKKDTKYEPWMCDAIVEVANNGGHVAQMCLAIGVNSRDTFYRWLELYPEFKEAYESASISSLAFYEQVMLGGGLGKIKNFNFNAIAMIMNNKYRGEYTRGTGAGTEINIGSINTLSHLDENMLNKKIEAIQHKLQHLGTSQETENE